MIRPGLLRHSIEIQKGSRSSDEYGEGVETWETVSTRKAAKTAKGVTQKEKAGQKVALEKVVFLMRYDPQVTCDARIVEGENVYDIISVVDPTGKCRELIVTTTKACC